jgi:CubicO group peptidase (beta-lactamase class C family)
VSLGQVPVTGQTAAGLESYDRFMFIAEWNIPGGALAVSRNGALVYARGFGYAAPCDHRCNYGPSQTILERYNRSTIFPLCMQRR